jgi:hypothetical protein
MKYTTLISLFALTLAACGGGGSAEAPAPTAVTPPSPAPSPAPAPEVPAPSPAPVEAPPPAPSPAPAPVEAPPPAPAPAPVFVPVSPVSATSATEQVFALSASTGPASFAIDGDPKTSWTAQGPATITFDLGSKKLIGGFEVSMYGWSNNVNYIQVYVDGALAVMPTEVRGFGSPNKFTFSPIMGQVIVYEILPDQKLPSTSTGWAEVSEFKALVAE